MSVFQIIVVLAAIACPNFALADRSLDFGMIALPGGSYIPFLSENSRKPVSISAFRIDRFPVTRKRFLDFVRMYPEWRKSNAKRVFAEPGYLNDWDSDLDPGSDVSGQAPITWVSWFAAKAYCESLGKSLPTTDQWEYAAFDRGKGPDEARRRSIEWFAQPGDGRLATVQSSAANGFGIHGLYDLVWEWTDDFDSDGMSDNSSTGSAFSCAGTSLSAIDPADYAAFMRYSYRDGLKADFTVESLGFRCVQGGQP